MSDLKLVKRRIDNDKYRGEYTYQSKKGQGTVDNVIMSMELFS